MNQLSKKQEGEYYHVKVQNGYVRSAFSVLKTVEFTPDVNKVKNLTKDELEFVLKLFPEAETRKFTFTVDREW